MGPAMHTMSVSKFKATCLDQIEQVARTRTPLVITKRGKPVAEVVPFGAAAAGRRMLGCMRGSVLTYGDIVSPAVPADQWDACS